MTVINKLATSLGRRDEVPNKELAEQIVKNRNKSAVEELVVNLKNKDKNIQSDCMKTLYEIGEAMPVLIADYDETFLELLSDKNNRLVWGAMTALDCIASVNPKGVYKSLNAILDTAEKGSVITRDHAISILIKLASEKNYSAKMMVLLIDQFRRCPTNQLPMYAENSLPVINGKYRKDFANLFSKRMKEMEKESQRKRLEKVIKKLVVSS